MEIFNGEIIGVVGRGKKQAVDMGSNYTHHCYRRILWGLIALCLLTGCNLAKVKSSLLTGSAVSTSVGVASALTNSAIVPALVGGTTAVVASAITAEPSVKGEPIEVTAEKVVQQAPDNFWTLLGKLVSVGGYGLLAIVLVPMLFSWLLPGPIQFKGRKKK